MEIKNTHRRDLELILIGAALTKGDRQRVLSVFEDFSFSKEGGLNPMLAAIRKGDAEGVSNWLGERGATMANGKDAIQTVIDTVHDDNKIAMVKSICRGLSFAGSLSQLGSLKERLAMALNELEKL